MWWSSVYWTYYVISRIQYEPWDCTSHWNWMYPLTKVPNCRCWMVLAPACLSCWQARLFDPLTMWAILSSRHHTDLCHHDGYTCPTWMSIMVTLTQVLSNKTFPNGSYPDPSAILKPTELEAIEADIQWWVTMTITNTTTNSDTNTTKNITLILFCRYMYSNAVPAGLLFLAILVYFPSAPSLPPRCFKDYEISCYIIIFCPWKICLSCLT